MGFSDVYEAYIQWIGDRAGLSDSMLHVHAGLAILLLARLISGRSFASVVPLSAVALAEFANELLDRIDFHSWRWSDTLGDVFNTLFWPCMIFLVARHYPERERGVIPR